MISAKQARKQYEEACDYSLSDVEDAVETAIRQRRDVVTIPKGYKLSEETKKYLIKRGYEIEETPSETTIKF